MLTSNLSQRSTLWVCERSERTHDNITRPITYLYRPRHKHNSTNQLFSSWNRDLFQRVVSSTLLTKLKSSFPTTNKVVGTHIPIGLRSNFSRDSSLAGLTFYNRTGSQQQLWPPIGLQNLRACEKANSKVLPSCPPSPSPGHEYSMDRLTKEEASVAFSSFINLTLSLFSSLKTFISATRSPAGQARRHTCTMEKRRPAWHEVTLIWRTGPPENGEAKVHRKRGREKVRMSVGWQVAHSA